MDGALRDFLAISYSELEALNVKAKQQRLSGTTEAAFEKEYRAMLKAESRIKAVTVCFSDIEGRLHMLDYDKHYFLPQAENLTFDGSSIRGFSALAESDLRLVPQWSTLRWLPADVFGPGKVLMFANIHNQDRTPHESDFRGVLQRYSAEVESTKHLVAHAAPEIEGMLLEGVDAEQRYNEIERFTLVSTGGYYHSLPKDRLRQFIDAAAEAQRAMGFLNEKDHPEVAPSQFELNFTYGPVVETCDQIQLYKLVCRQVARSQGMTATFLPKPFSGINGSGMHLNLSLAKNGKNMFADARGQYGLSRLAQSFIRRILHHAPELCLTLNASVNGYRRLDPNFEAPNQIKVSPTDRGSMIRIPIASEASTRIEVRSVGPDANPYLALYALVRTGLEGVELKPAADKRPRLRYLPGTMTEALRDFKSGEFIAQIMGAENHRKYAAVKQMACDRSPKELGTTVKASEILYHHEVTNQVLWHSF